MLTTLLKRLRGAASPPTSWRARCCVCGVEQTMDAVASHYQSPVGNAWSGSACTRCLERRAASPEDIAHALTRAFGRTVAEHLRLHEATRGRNGEHPVSVLQNGDYVPLDDWIRDHSRPVLHRLGRTRLVKRPPKPLPHATTALPGLAWLQLVRMDGLRAPRSAAAMLAGEPDLRMLTAEHAFSEPVVRVAHVGLDPQAMSDVGALRACLRFADELRADLHPRLFPHHHSGWGPTTLELSRHGTFLLPDAHPDEAWFDPALGDRVVVLEPALPSSTPSHAVRAVRRHFAEFHPEIVLPGLPPEVPLDRALATGTVGEVADALLARAVFGEATLGHGVSLAHAVAAVWVDRRDREEASADTARASLRTLLDLDTLVALANTDDGAPRLAHKLLHAHLASSALPGLRLNRGRAEEPVPPNAHTSHALIKAPLLAALDGA